MDGKYKAEGREVWRSPTRTGTGILMGFKVCTLAEHVPEEVAQEIADALNMHMAAHPEKH
jgi:hypothetical protein